MRHLPPFRLFAVFEAIVRTGSPQRAAEEMNVSQPAISQAIKALENHVGAQLFDRKTRPPVLTEAGRILQLAVIKGLGQISDAIADVHALNHRSQHSATIACSVGTATYWLMPRLTQFYKSHPDVSVNVITTALGAPAFVADIDLAIRYGAGLWTDGHVTRLFDDSVVPVCHPAMFERFSNEAGGLSGLPLLHVNSGDDSWLGWRDYVRLAGQSDSRVAGRTFTNYVQATQAALDGQGVMLGWSSNTDGLIKDGALVALPLPKVQPAEAFYLAVAPRSAGKPDVIKLCDWLILISRRQNNENS